MQTEEMKAGNPLRVCVERYGFLPVDKAAFKGGIPEIQNMIPFEPFDFYIRRKLFVHNMGHAVCAYLGLYTHRDYISEAIEDPCIQNIVQNAMLESALALSRAYGVSVEPLIRHFQDLLMRFKNRALKDTCSRVGGDPKRKLSPTDRLTGASLLCLENGIYPVFISVGTAGAVYEYIWESGEEQSMEKARQVLGTIAGLEESSPLWFYILPFYQRYMDGVSVREIMDFAEKMRKQEQKEVV